MDSWILLRINESELKNESSWEIKGGVDDIEYKGLNLGFLTVYTIQKLRINLKWNSLSLPFKSTSHALKGIKIKVIQKVL